MIHTNSVANLNASARSQRNSIVALDVDKPVKDSFELRTLKTPGFPGTAGDGKLQLVGFTGIDHPESGTIELLVINNGPSVNAETGELLNKYSHGPNSTVDLFETGPEATQLKYVRTYADRKIATPNRVAALSRNAFYVVNDHGQSKVGLVSHIITSLNMVLTRTSNTSSPPCSEKATPSSATPKPAARPSPKSSNTPTA